MRLSQKLTRMDGCFTCLSLKIKNPKWDYGLKAMVHFERLLLFFLLSKVSLCILSCLWSPNSPLSISGGVLELQHAPPCLAWKALGSNWLTFFPEGCSDHIFSYSGGARATFLHPHPQWLSPFDSIAANLMGEEKRKKRNMISSSSHSLLLNRIQESLIWKTLGTMWLETLVCVYVCICVHACRYSCRFARQGLPTEPHTQPMYKDSKQK